MLGRIIIVAVLFLQTAAVVAREKQPWSEIAVGTANPTSSNEYDVSILAIDGSMHSDDRLSVPLAPGPHLLYVATTMQGRRGEVTAQSFFLETAPCFRYYLVANHERQLSNRMWSVEVKKTKPIRRCVAPASGQAVQANHDNASPLETTPALDGDQ